MTYCNFSSLFFFIFSRNLISLGLPDAVVPPAIALLLRNRFKLISWLKQKKNIGKVHH